MAHFLELYLHLSLGLTQFMDFLGRLIQPLLEVVDIFDG